MTITLRPDIERELQERLKSGLYPSPDQMINDALELFMGIDSGSEFEPGELDGLLAVGEKQLAVGQFITAEEMTRRRKNWGRAFRQGE